MMLSSGNEPAGPWQQILTPWLLEWKRKDNRRIFTTQTGRYYGERPGPVDHIDYLIAIRIGSYRFRGDSGWFGRDYRASLEGTNYPVISHETDQWCAYPDLSEIDRYTGALSSELRDRSRSLAERGMLDQARDFLMASGRFQVACYKQEIEALRARRAWAGSSCSICTTTRARARRWSGPERVLGVERIHHARGVQAVLQCHCPAGADEPVVYTTADDLNVAFEIAHFGQSPLENVTPAFRIVDAKAKRSSPGSLPR
jgi:hypothetical protein